MGGKTDSKIKCASFFAGVGGIDLGFESTNQFEIIYANEFDSFPVKTYELNSKIKVDCRDIRTVQPTEIPDFDLLMGGFPCQAFSIAGQRKGFDDEKGRGTLFFELLRIVNAKKSKIIFLENVKNLKSHDNGNTYNVIKSELENSGYFVTEKILNAMEYPKFLLMKSKMKSSLKLKKQHYIKSLGAAITSLSLSQ